MNTIKHKTTDRGIAYVGGYASLAVAIILPLSLLTVAWAIFSPQEDAFTAISLAFIFGFLILCFTSLRVKWELRDGYIKVSQMHIPKKIKISNITSIEILTGMKWKQGVGIRSLGDGGWAMLCGTDELVSITYNGKKFIFSANDASSVQSAISHVPAP